MVDVSSQNNSVSVNVSAGGSSASINATPDMAQYYSEKSREWATSNRIVDNTDYSSKYYAEQSKDNAEEALSAKELVLEAKDGVIAEVASEGIRQKQALREAAQLEQEEIQTIVTRIDNGKAVYMGNTEPTDDIYTVWVSPEDNEADLKIEEIEKNIEKIAKTRITNCITELPQNIKLDLADGILTLKAGSIVTMPNGFEADGVTPKFDYVTIESDNQLDLKNIPARSFLFWAPSTQKFNYRPMETVYSGSSDPATSATTYYQINNNIVVSHNLSGDINVTLPILIFNSDGVNVFIDQVFNGFGYIGSTVFALPGVKGLIPNGRNEDGSLKNEEFSASKTLILTLPANFSIDKAHIVVNNEVLALIGKGSYRFDEQNNYLYNNNDIALGVEIGNLSSSSSKIDNFQTKQAFRALDYNDKPEIASWGMPSDKYIDLTIGATGAIYVAPANGFINVLVNSADGYLYVNCFDSNNTYCYSSTESNGTSTTGSRALCPIRKGHKYQIGYSGTVSQFRFIYAQGEV